MSVFENEGNVSQDANFRAHLDSNWDSGNREFDKVEGQLRIALDDIQFLKNEIHDLRGDVKALNQRCDKIEEKHNDDIKTVQEPLDRLNNVVFGLAPAEINTPPVPDYSNKRLEEINFDDRKDKTNKW